MEFLEFLKKKHIVSAPPVAVNPQVIAGNRSSAKGDRTGPLMSSIMRSCKAESEWVKSFESLQTKRNHFVNNSTPVFESVIPLIPQHHNKELIGAESSKLVRHYSIYMPEVVYKFLIPLIISDSISKSPG